MSFFELFSCPFEEFFLRSVARFEAVFIRVPGAVVMVICASSVVPEAKRDGFEVCSHFCFSIEVVDFCWGVDSEFTEANAASKFSDSFEVSSLIFRCSP